MRSTYIAVVATTVMFASCEKDIDVKIPDYKPLLVLNSNTEVDDTIRVTVGKSEGILNYKTGHNLSVNNAIVQLYSGSNLLETMKYDSASGTYNSKTIAVEGGKYTLKVNAPGYAEASAATIAPAFVPIAGIQRIKNARINQDQQQQDELRITFNDPPTKRDYYIISIIRATTGPDSSSPSYSTCVNTIDASVEDISNDEIDQNTCIDGQWIFLRDELFNGTTKELKLFVESGFLENGGAQGFAEIVLQHVTEDYFKFQKTYRFAADNNGNPFAEPTNVYTNIKNGYGVFSILSYDVAEIK